MLSSSHQPIWYYPNVLVIWRVDLYRVGFWGRPLEPTILLSTGEKTRLDKCDGVTVFSDNWSERRELKNRITSKNCVTECDSQGSDDGTPARAARRAWAAATKKERETGKWFDKKMEGRRRTKEAVAERFETQLSWWKIKDPGFASRLGQAEK